MSMVRKCFVFFLFFFFFFGGGGRIIDIMLFLVLLLIPCINHSKGPSFQLLDGFFEFFSVLCFKGGRVFSVNVLKLKLYL